MEFTLTILLENVAMQNGGDVADALHDVARKMDTHGMLTDDIDGTIRDANGNLVGSYQVIDT